MFEPASARIAILLAPGFEEIEAVTVIDVLRRARLSVTTLSLDLAGSGSTGSLAVEGAHGISIVADRASSDALEEDWALIVLPGGLPGAHHLRDDSTVQARLQRQVAEGRAVAAICAAPVALGRAGLLQGRRATCYPGCEGELTGARSSDAAVVRDGLITTSRGVGTALAFALELVSQHAGEDTAQQLAQAMLVHQPSGVES